MTPEQEKAALDWLRPLQTTVLHFARGRDLSRLRRDRPRRRRAGRNAVDVDASLRVTPCTALPNNRDL
jgi:hypothetical protein